MSARITIIKSYRNKETLRLVELQELASVIREGEYQEAVEKFRHDLPLMPYVYRDSDGSFGGYADWPKNLPRICFALQQGCRKGERITWGYTGLVLLEVNNLPGDDEAAAVRNGAAEMPQTLMAFVGADGKSVRIVCRGELFPNEAKRLSVKVLPTEEDDIALFHENLYERARMIYNGQEAGADAPAYLLYELRQRPDFQSFGYAHLRQGGEGYGVAEPPALGDGACRGHSL